MSIKPAPVAVLAALLALIFWGGTAIANRYAVGFADPIVVATLRSMLASDMSLTIMEAGGEIIQRFSSQSDDSRSPPAGAGTN